MLLGIEDIENDLELAEYFQTMLTAFSTGGEAEEAHYVEIREYLLSNPAYKELMPRWVRINRNLGQFWQFIKNKFPSYAERRAFLHEELSSLLEFIESGDSFPAAKNVEEVLSGFSADNIHFAWQKAIERKNSDPEGAITLARSILESVCKHILHERDVQFDEKNIELSELYKLTAKELNMSPEQHNESIFKQILGGCSGIVNGLGNLRNKYGDAHGSSPKKVKPKARHAELAVNLAGTMALFLISTYSDKNP